MATWRSIFCSTCGELALDAARCPHCGAPQHEEADEPGGVLWRADLGYTLPRPRCYPVLVTGNLCVPTDEGRIVAVSIATGAKVWEYSLPEHSAAYSLEDDGERVFAGPYDTRAVPGPGRALIALDGATGALAWTYAAASHSFSGPVLLGDAVFVTTADGRIHALDSASGELRWVQPHPDWGPAAAAAGGGVVVAGGRGELLVGYDAEDGHELWRFQGGGWFATRPAVTGDLVVARCWDGLLYGLDARTGELRWKLQGERGQGFTSPPAAMAGLVLIGDRVAGPNRGGYALRALDAATGQERWRHLVPRYVSALPASTGDLILCPTESQSLLALGANDGLLRWQVPLAANATGRPVVAAEQAFIADEAGGITAVRARVSGAAYPNPDDLLAAGDHAGAAAAFVLSGDLIAGAKLYEHQLSMPAAAARVYEHAGLPNMAAPLWERADELQRARAAYRAAGDMLGLAELLAANGEPLEAAHLFEGFGRLERAAKLYELAGNKARAAELYADAGLLADSSRADSDLQLWEQDAAGLIAAGKPAEAAALLVEHGQLERAAELYQQADKLADALLLRLDLHQWARAVELAIRVGDMEHAAECYEQLGDKQRAAECYEQAAAKALSADPADPRLLAGLYERAARLYGEIFDTERAEAAALEMRRHRMLPDLQLTIGVEHEFVEQEWSTATLKLRNTGFGPARGIQVRASERFELGDAPVLAGIAAGREINLIVSLRPQASQVGRVPLSITVAFLDSQETSYEARAQILARVLPRGAEPGHATPPGGVLPVSETPRHGEVALTMRFDLDSEEVEIAWEADILGVRHSRFTPPFNGADLELVVRALDRLQHPMAPLAPFEVTRLGELGLPTDDAGLDPLGHRAVGRALYKALVADPRGAMALSTVRNHARYDGKALSLRLRFPPDAIELAALPWELLWDEGPTPLLLSHQRLAGCTRHLELAEALPPSRPRSGPLRILAITPHAGVDPDERERERVERTASWAPLIASGEVVMEELGPATRRNLVDRLLTGPPPDIIHFVGHGRYADGEGWLVLDKPGGGWDRVPSHQLLPLFGETRLVVLCACQGGMVGDSGLLTGVAPALSAAGVPAVVAMQLTVRASAATRFAEILYRALARGESIQRAVVQARQALYIEEADAASWYVPTLTIRARDPGPLYLMTG